MKALYKNEKCSGCGCCATICPKQCIRINLNEDGFFRPFVNKSECINCGLCRETCPFNCDMSEILELDDAELYSANVKDSKIRERSSSGGIAYYLARQLLQKNFIVCGVEYNYKLRRAENIIVDSFENLQKIQKSKYLQSYSLDAFKDIVESLTFDKKKKVVIFGTPCQIAGLNKLLSLCKLRERAILIEIYCMGTPSYLLWEAYYKYLSDNKKFDIDNIISLDFRDKKYSWHEYYMHIITAEKEYVKDRNVDPFLRLFCQGVMSQKVCFDCPYRNSSFADIRLGDYWGKRYAYTEEGFSMVLVNTKDGKNIWENAVSYNDIAYRRMPVSDRLAQQTKPYVIPQYYEESFEILRNGYSIMDIYNLYNSPISIMRTKLFKKKEKIKAIATQKRESNSHLEE